MLETTTQELIRQGIDRFWECVPATWNQVRMNLRATAAQDFDISFEQFTILRHIRRGSKSISELAEARRISRPAISQAVEMLVGRGLISRQQSTQDRRWVDLELTPSGNDILNTIFQKNSVWMAEKLAVLSPEELQSLLLGLEALKKTFDS
jgi:DNA-binding MarR family transcriptional regulator